MNRIILIACAMLTLCTTSQKETNRIESLKTFAKAYGYVKYFHPSDEASSIDWNRFSAYGASEIMTCKTQAEVIKKLNTLFKPIAPTIVFSDKKLNYKTNILIPAKKREYTTTYWQHRGVSKGMNARHNAYSSIRVNASNKTTKNGKTKVRKGKPKFDASPEIGELIEEEIGNNIYCQIPLRLYVNDKGTYPKSETLNTLQKKLNTINVTSIDLATRLGNIINTYNVFQHFHPYFKEAGVDWDKEFETALNRSFDDNTYLDHQITLQKFTATLKDGHTRVSDNKTGLFYLPPIYWEFIENKLVITKVLDDKVALQVGDIVTKINNTPVEEYFKELKSTISAGTDGWANFMAQIESLRGNRDTKLIIEVNSKTITLKRDIMYTSDATKMSIQEHLYKKLDHNIYYINIDKAPMDTITKLLPALQKADGIICDLRGYPEGNDGLISHLLKENDTSTSWMRIPKIIYPDQKNIVGYEKRSWGLKAKKPYLGDKKVVFIISGRAISYSESYMGFIRGYNLATIIGQPTAGTNGNVTSFRLLGNLRISWTGMKVVKHDNSQLYSVGILPDIYVNKTIEGVKAGEDEFLNKAIEVILEK